MKKKVLFICGSLNQTSQMFSIASQLTEYDSFFTPYYADGLLELARKAGILEWTILGNKAGDRAVRFLLQRGCKIDFHGRKHEYDLVITCQDLIIPRNIRRKRIVLVQEGMTDPENFAYHVVRALPFLPRWLASTSTTGLSDAYELFCVASEGYRELFVRKGVNPDKIRVTGIPNFDDCTKYLNNEFPYKNFVLVCTSDSRETFGSENRRDFILKALKIAAGRQLIFKLHPNENAERAIGEINRLAPSAIVFAEGKAEEMVANCDVLITRYSSTAYVGLALGKEVHSDFDVEQLRSLVPIQNGSAASKIAGLCRGILEEEVAVAARSRRIASRVRAIYRGAVRRVSTEVGS